MLCDPASVGMSDGVERRRNECEAAGRVGVEWAGKAYNNFPFTIIFADIIS